MALILFVPFFVQALLIAFDEGYYHLRRGLPRFERIGHPLDTFTILACLVYTLAVPFSPELLKGYVALALFSSLFVTKDEFVHSEHCCAAEQWLHACLFLNHSIMLTSLGVLWAAMYGAGLSPILATLVPPKEVIRQILGATVLSISGFMIYQIVFWNFVWKDSRPESITNSTKSSSKDG